jgi:hypothetical protein
VALNEQDWAIRLHVYRFFVENERPPTFEETAEHFNLTPDEARLAYHRLHDGHAFFLDPGTDRIRMANPLSAVETPFVVRVNGKRLYANCAWDTLGIPAMLHADAQIEAMYSPSGERVTYTIESGKLIAPDVLIHFALPFRHWYDDLVHT